MSPRRWAFISDHRAVFGVKRICRVLGASRAGYYRHLATEQTRAGRRAEEKRTVSEIRAIHAEHQGAYGAPRVPAELRERAQDQPQARHPADADQPHRRPSPAEEAADDDRGQDHAARAGPGDARLHRGRPEHQVVRRHHLRSRRCDVALPRHGDRHRSRKAVGWSIADHMRTSLVTDAIEMAVVARGSRGRGVIFHTDRGAQYSAAAITDDCRRSGIRRSMGRSGSSYDNALAESFFQGSSASCSTDAAGPRRHRPGSSCSAGFRTTTGAVGIPRSATSHQPSSNGN